MEWDPGDREGWVADAERWICQIHGVLQSKIDVASDGEVEGVHVVAGMERDPRHIVRDVEGLLKARLGLDVFYKKIGVVQVVDNENEMTEDNQAIMQQEMTDGSDAGHHEITPAVLLEESLTPRILCSGVGVLASDLSVRAEVELNAGSLEVRGVEEGPNHLDSDLNLIARATVAAIGKLLDEPVLLSLSEIRLTQIAGETVVMVAVELVEGRRSLRLFGACQAQHNRQQAAAYAVLDALNRRLALMSFKTPDGID